MNHSDTVNCPACGEEELQVSVAEVEYGKFDPDTYTRPVRFEPELLNAHVCPEGATAATILAAWEVESEDRAIAASERRWAGQ